MIKPRLLLIAEGVIRDARTGAISVFNIVEGMSSPGFPLFIPRLFVLSMLDREQEDPETLEVELVLDLNGEELFKRMVTINFEDKHRNRNIVQIGGLPLPGPGLFTVSVVHENRLLQSYWLDVTKIGGPELTTIAQTS